MRYIKIYLLTQCVGAYEAMQHLKDFFDNILKENFRCVISFILCGLLVCSAKNEYDQGSVK